MSVMLGAAFVAQLVVSHADELAPNEPPAAAQANIERDSNQAHAIGSQLRCPVCQGMPISESPSEMAQDMMKRVRAMQAEGKSQDEILDYFVARYGEWVLLKPRAHGINLGLWLLPAAGLVFGALLVWRYWRRARGQAGAAPARGTASALASKAAASEDPYVRRVREEVDE